MRWDNIPNVKPSVAFLKYISHARYSHTPLSHQTFNFCIAYLSSTAQSIFLSVIHHLLKRSLFARCVSDIFAFFLSLHYHFLLTLIHITSFFTDRFMMSHIASTSLNCTCTLMATFCSFCHFYISFFLYHRKTLCRSLFSVAFFDKLSL